MSNQQDVSRKRDRNNEKAKLQQERKTYKGVLKTFDAHKERKQHANKLAQERPQVDVRGENIIDSGGAARRLVETHSWPMGNCKTILSHRIRGWANRADRAAQMTDTCQPFEHFTTLQVPCRFDH